MQALHSVINQDNIKSFCDVDEKRSIAHSALKWIQI
jgi:hypothetical protein